MISLVYLFSYTFEAFIIELPKLRFKLLQFTPNILPITIHFPSSPATGEYRHELSMISPHIIEPKWGLNSLTELIKVKYNRGMIRDKWLSIVSFDMTKLIHLISKPKCPVDSTDNSIIFFLLIRPSVKIPLLCYLCEVEILYTILEISFFHCSHRCSKHPILASEYFIKISYKKLQLHVVKRIQRFHNIFLYSMVLKPYTTVSKQLSIVLLAWILQWINCALPPKLWYYIPYWPTLTIFYHCQPWNNYVSSSIHAQLSLLFVQHYSLLL